MGFLSFNLLDILDILMVALLLTYLYRAIKGSSAYYIFAGVLAFYLLWLIVRFLRMELMTMILGQILGVGVIAMIVVFQPEIRRFLLFIGNKYIKRFNKIKFVQDNTDVEEIINACQSMSADKVGALIVLTRSDKLEQVVNTGDRVDAEISQRLIETIFFKNSPLHDGAVIVSDNRIVAARCLLPVTESNIPAYYGTRHRAAIGISERSDAAVIVVSEQTGKISYVADGLIERGVTPLQLKNKLLNK